MAITPGNFNFTIYIGNTLNIPLTWSDQTGTPINNTGYSATLECRYNLTDSSPFLTLSSPSNGITLSGSTGIITLNANTSTTAALNAGIGLYDLQMTDTLGNVFTLLQGTVTVQEMITR